MYVISISALATALIVNVVVSITVIVIIIARSKAKTKAGLDLKPTNVAERSIHTNQRKKMSLDLLLQPVLLKHEIILPMTIHKHHH